MIRIVPPTGPKDAKIVLIGEAPGREENETGIPFVGAAGKHLNNLLHMAGLARSGCYLTNVVKKRPPNNDISGHISHNRGKTTTSAEFRLCAEELYKELDALSPTVLVPLGNVPLFALTKEWGITKWRGSILWSDRFQCKVIPTVHPSAALREATYNNMIVHDLIRARLESKSKELTRPETSIKIGPSYSEVMAYLDAIEKGPVSIDIEVTNEEVSCIAFSPAEREVMCIPFTCTGQGDYFDPDQETAIWRKIAEVLESPDIGIIGQNIVFDASFLLRKYGIKTSPLVGDTMVAAGILYPQLPKGLDFLTSMYTHYPYYKDDGKRWKRADVTDQAYWNYNAMDAMVCQEIHTRQLAELKAQGNLSTYQRTLSILEPLVYLQEYGMLVDVDMRTRLKQEVAEQLKAAEAELAKLCGADFNPRSPAQLRSYFYGTKNIRPYLDKGRITTNVHAMKRIAAKGYREAQLILEIRRLGKLNSTYLNMPLDGDHRMRSSFNPVGTVTGRLSSSKNIFGTGGNMQNLPKSSDFRRCLVADPGYVLYGPDLSQAENRIVAYIAPEPMLINAFESEKDVHVLTAALIFGKPPEEISREPGSCGLGAGDESERDWGKRANHAFNYGFGKRKFAIRYELPEKEAGFIRERYLAAYPGIPQSYWPWVEHMLRTHGSITNCLGRVRKFIGRNEPTDAYAQIPQSTVGDMINEWGVAYLYYEELCQPAELLNQIHDQVLFQIPLSAGWERHAAILKGLKASLEQPLHWKGRTFSIPLEVKLGRNMKDMKVVKEVTPDELERTYASVCDAVGS